MKLVKVLLIAATVSALIFGAFWQFWLKDQIQFAQVGTAYSAKMVCSCRFVAERPMASCQKDFTLDLSAINFSVSSSLAVKDGVESVDNTVIASVLGGLVKSEARYEPGLGCALVKP